MLKLSLMRNTQVVGENDGLWSILHQPAVGRVAHNCQGPRASIDGTELPDAAKCTQRRILHNVFGVFCIAGEPWCQTIGFGHVRQKDFTEHCAIILVLHNSSPPSLLSPHPTSHLRPCLLPA